MRILALLALTLAVAIIACTPTSSPTEDLAAVEGRLDTIDGHLSGLTEEAQNLQVALGQPLSLSDIDIGSASGLVVYSPADEVVTIEPGECDLPAPSTRVPPGTVMIGTYHQAPSGPHCVAIESAGVAVDVEPGTIAAVTLTPGGSE